jgi:hypothetical protein
MLFSNQLTSLVDTRLDARGVEQKTDHQGFRYNRRLLEDPEKQVGDAGRFDDPRAFKRDRRSAEVVEQTDAFPSSTGTRSMWISSPLWLMSSIMQRS